MVLNRPSFEEKSPVYIDKGKVFLDLGYRFFFYQKIKNTQNHEDNFEFIWMISSLFVIKPKKIHLIQNYRKIINFFEQADCNFETRNL
jgi:hypothetical protein